MTKNEISQKYNISSNLLNMYESVNNCKSYNDEDIEAIGMIMTLYNVGFDDSEVKNYIGLYLSDNDTSKKRKEILTNKRRQILDEIHARQKQLENIDYLRYKITKGKNTTNETEEF